MYAVENGGRELQPIQHMGTEGAHPRHFALTPDGGFLLAANKDTDNIAVFRVDGHTGKLEYTGRSISVSQPVCVVPFLN